MDARLSQLIQEYGEAEKESTKAASTVTDLKSKIEARMKKLGLKQVKRRTVGAFTTVNPVLTVWDFDGLKKIVNDPKIRKSAKKSKMDLTVIKTTETVDRDAIEALLKAHIIPLPMIRRVRHNSPGTSYLRFTRSK